MSANPNEWKKFFESLLSAPLVSGACLYFLSITVDTLHKNGSINAADIGTWVLPLIRILGVISYFLMFLGILFIVADLLKRTFLWGSSKWNERSQNKKEITRLLENIDRLSPKAKLLFYAFLKEPSGRFYAPPPQIWFDEIIDNDLVYPDRPILPVMIVKPLQQGDQYRVDELLYTHLKKRDKTFSKFAKKHNLPIFN